MKSRTKIKVRKSGNGNKISVVYIKEIAKRFHDIRYYINRGDEEKNLLRKENEKARFATPKRTKITDLLKKYKELGKEKINTANIALQSISVKNIAYMLQDKTPPVHTNIMSLISSIPLLVQAYKKIKKNRGAMTAAAGISSQRWKTFTPFQKKFLSLTKKTPDGISMETFHITSQILRKGQYPWGVSKRIYIAKPGVMNKKRPITIPPFMDKIVQQNIKVVLEAMYEPWFDQANCSFGFRPGKSTHSAIVAISSIERPLYHAIEGDIEAAYDRVNKEKLIKILEKRIKDTSFMKLMRSRLDYIFFDAERKQYETPKDGIPQGGIDSPYLFNIYMKEFDDWILKHLNQESVKINNKLRINKHTGKGLISEGTRTQIKEKTAITRLINKEKTNVKIKKIKKEKHETIRKIRILQHIKLQMPSRDINRDIITFTYSRYADDWIILNNASILTNNKLKDEIGIWLKENLDATLSEKKTLITDMRKEKAHYLGFQLSVSKTRKISKKWDRRSGHFVLTKVAGHKIRIYPDDNRLINRCYMKGYCNKKGKPKEIPWISGIEPFMIIEKYNAVIRGFAQFYTEFISNKLALSRWIYIYRFSCIKTLAQKYRTSTRKIFERFASRNPEYRKNFGKTIEIKVRIKYKNNTTYEKTYRLITLREALKLAIDCKQKAEYEMHNSIFQNIKKTTISVYRFHKKNSSNPNPSSPDYLDRIKWVNWRTMCSLDMPCSICGFWKGMSSQMHHIRHVRKRKYSEIKEHETWKKVMSIRNRKQLPTCEKCHMELIHEGKYKGTALKLMMPKTLIDNRIITVENYVNPGKLGEDYRKTLAQRGWKIINQDK